MAVFITMALIDPNLSPRDLPRARGLWAQFCVTKPPEFRGFVRRNNTQRRLGENFG